MSDAGVVRLLVFRVGGLLCAAEAERVREILPRLATTRIPGAPPAGGGLVHLRGTLVAGGGGWRGPRPPGAPPAQAEPGGATPVPPGRAGGEGPWASGGG